MRKAVQYLGRKATVEKLPTGHRFDVRPGEMVWAEESVCRALLERGWVPVRSTGWEDLDIQPIPPERDEPLVFIPPPDFGEVPAPLMSGPTFTPPPDFGKPPAPREPPLEFVPPPGFGELPPPPELPLDFVPPPRFGEPPLPPEPPLEFVPPPGFGELPPSREAPVVFVPPPGFGTPPLPLAPPLLVTEPRVADELGSRLKALGDPVNVLSCSWVQYLGGQEFVGDILAGTYYQHVTAAPGQVCFLLYLACTWLLQNQPLFWTPQTVIPKALPFIHDGATGLDVINVASTDIWGVIQSPDQTFGANHSFFDPFGQLGVNEVAVMFIDGAGVPYLVTQQIGS